MSKMYLFCKPFFIVRLHGGKFKFCIYLYFENFAKLIKKIET